MDGTAGPCADSAGMCIGMRLIVSSAFLCGLAGCGPIQAAPPQDQAARLAEAPPLPDDAETVDFEADLATMTDEPTEADTTTTASAPVYWGVAEGEPLTIMWEDLLPEGEEEILMQAYEEFYAMLEQRYAANTTTLVDAARGMDGIAEGSDLDYMPQLGSFNVVEDLDDTFIRMPGYVVPFDFDSKSRHNEFLFVPYMGACIHSPPPPPNQIIFVRADPAQKIKDIWAPYWIEGTLTTEQTENELGDTAYALSLRDIKPYPMP